MKPKLPPELRSRFRSKVEERYADYLERLRLAGDILQWEYEPETFVLAYDCRYTPDWLIDFKDKATGRHAEYHATTGWTRDDATVKLKVFAEQVWPYEVYSVKRVRGAWVKKLVKTVKGEAARKKK